MPRVLVASDNFNRAGPALGANWAQLDNAGGGDLVIVGSATVAGQFSAATNRPACARWVGAGSITDNQYSSVRLVNGSAAISGTQWAGVIARASADTGTTRDMYLLYKQLSGASNNVVLAKALNGTFSILNTVAQAAADNDLLSLEVTGQATTTLKAFLNGAELFSVDDTTSPLLTGSFGPLATDSAVIDDWEGGNITAGGAQDLAAAATAAATAAAQLAIEKALGASAGAAGLAAADPLLLKFLLAAASGQAVASGDLGLAKLLAGSAAGGATATGQLQGGATLTTPPLKNNTGTVLASESDVTVHVYTAAGAHVVTKTGQTTNGAGVMTINDALLVAATSYRVIIALTSGAEGMETLTAA